MIDQSDFPSHPKALKIPFGQNFCAAGKFLKKQAKMASLGFFGKFWPKIQFFLARASSKLVYNGAEGAFWTFVESIAKKRYFKIEQRGETLGRQGVESLRGVSASRALRLAF